MLWRELYPAVTEQLGSPVEARWLVEAAAGGTFPHVLDELVTARAARWLEERVVRRRAGEPLQYVLGRWAFRRLDLLVDRRVLIPRPETEQVVELALDDLRRRADPVAGSPRSEPRSGGGSPRSEPRSGGGSPRSETRSGGGSPRLGGPQGDGLRGPVIVDLGTGSGAIALSIAVEHPVGTIWATDASSDALDVARANLSGVGGAAAARVRLVGGEWWDALPPELHGRVDLVVSNPPYIASHEIGGLDAEVTDWEPRVALEAGPGGLEDVAVILGAAPGWLAPGGAAVIEIAPHQAAEAADLARAAGFAGVGVHPDLAGRDRAIVAHLPL